MHSPMPEVAVAVLGVVVVTAVGVAVGAPYTVTAWACLRRWGSAALLLLWGGVALATGVLGYWQTCSLGLTCDVGGVNYPLQLVPPAAFTGAVGFGIATVLVARRAQGLHRRGLGVRGVLLGGAGVVVGMFLAVQLLLGIQHLTCANRVYRRLDGS